MSRPSFPNSPIMYVEIFLWDTPSRALNIEIISRREVSVSKRMKRR